MIYEPGSYCNGQRWFLLMCMGECIDGKAVPWFPINPDTPPMYQRKSVLIVEDGYGKSIRIG